MEALLFGIFGLIVGSFLNVLIVRENSGRDLFGRSACVACKKQLKARDLVPVLSWLYLRGRCRYCSEHISIQYPFVEVLTAILFALVGFSALPILLKCIGVLIVSVFVAIAVYDIYYTIIPDTWNYSASALTLVYGLVQIVDPSEVLYVLLAGFLAALPLFALWFVSRGRWMGFGDVKLAVAIGFLLGPVQGPMAIVGAFILGALVSVCILLPLSSVVPHLPRIGITALSRGGAHFTMRSEVPFGPFLIASCITLWILHAYGVTLPLVL